MRHLCAPSTHAAQPSQVTGDRGEGVATVEAVNHRGRAVLTLLAVDVAGTQLAAPEMLLVVGSEAKLHEKGGLRAFLQMERAQFIPQDVAPSEEALLEEQAAAAAKGEPSGGEGSSAGTPPAA